MCNFTKSRKEASQITKQINDKVYALLDFDDQTEFDFAQKGLIAAPDSLTLKREDGKIIWSIEAFDFVKDKNAPDTANPSLWRNTQLNRFHGLFQVHENIYQVRGYDLTNITFIKGDTGWIVFDPLTSVETSAAAKQLVDEHLGFREVKAVVISHPHIDHFGGIKGIIDEKDVLSGKIPIIVPEHFEEHAVSENLYAGNAMARRAAYQYGNALETDEKGILSLGIGISISKGQLSYISPTDVIKETGEIREIDGVTMEFQITPGTEAPAEMNTWFPQFNALWMAENCTCSLHNLLTLRGAQVRDGNAWAEYIMESIKLYGEKAEVVFQSHNWPHWGNKFIIDYMTNTAAAYKFINDQTLMYINQGYTPNEIAEMITLPAELEKNWYTRQYYGTIQHNSKAVYQRFMGWYDGNPAHLNPLAPSKRAEKFIEYLGEPSQLIEKLKVDYEKGQYQWVAEISNILVFADSTNESARYLCADALEQLGYQAESGIWRGLYLVGAKELREGTIRDPKTMSSKGTDMLQAFTPEMIFDYLGIIVDNNSAQDINAEINVNFTDTDNYSLKIKSGVFLYTKGHAYKNPDLTLTLPKVVLTGIIMRNKDAIKMAKVEGDESLLDNILGNMVTYDPFFNIVEP